MYLVFDIGGTNMRVGVSSDGKTISSTKIVPTPQDFEVGIKIIKQTADELSKGEKIEAVTGGIAVIFGKDKSVPIHTSHLHGWVNKPLKQSLENQFQAPIVLENDTAVAGLGEANFGAGVGKSIVTYLTISTGIGGVRVVDGKIDANCLGFEPGHQIIVIDGKDCYCGGTGHFETYVAGWYLERDYHMKGEDIQDPKIWDVITRYLAVGLNNTIVHWSPDIVVLGGAVMQSVNLEQVKVYLKNYLTIFPTAPEIVKASLGDEAGLYGALELINQKG